MTAEKLAATIDNTLLSPLAVGAEIDYLGEETKKNGYATAVVHPYWVDFLREKHPAIKICQVINFPTGLSISHVHTLAQVNKASDEYDMVINLAMLREKKYKELVEEIKALKAFVGPKIVKVIIESGVLTKDELYHAVAVVAESGADFVKTSTGSLAQTDAQLIDQVEEIAHFINTHNSSLKIKASGGIKTWSLVRILLGLGVTRIGTSAATRIVSEFKRGER